MKNKKIIDISDNRTLLSKFSYLYAKINRLMNHFKKAALSAFPDPYIQDILRQKKKRPFPHG